MPGPSLPAHRSRWNSPVNPATTCRLTRSSEKARSSIIRLWRLRPRSSDSNARTLYLTQMPRSLLWSTRPLALLWTARTDPLPKTRVGSGEYGKTALVQSKAHRACFALARALLKSRPSITKRGQGPGPLPRRARGPEMPLPRNPGTRPHRQPLMAGSTGSMHFQCLHLHTDSRAVGYTETKCPRSSQLLMSGSHLGLWALSWACWQCPRRPPHRWQPRPELSRVGPGRRPNPADAGVFRGTRHGVPRRTAAAGQPTGTAPLQAQLFGNTNHISGK